MKLVFPKGSTSRIVTVFIQASNVTTGAGLSGLTNTSGIVGGYVREGGTGVALAVDEDVTTEGTYQAPSAAGKVRIGTPANMRAGTYELHFHNNLFATGGETVTITLGGAANMADLAIEIQLSDPVSGLGAPTALADWADGGRLDLILDIIAADTTTDIPATLATIAGYIDTEIAAIVSDLAKVPKSDGVVSLNATVLAAIADALLDRNMATGTDSGSTTVRTPRQALRALRNKWAISGGTLTVNKEDDATASWTSAVTGTAGADPVTSSDPAGP